MPAVIDRLLASPACALLARLLLASAYAWSGVAKLLDFPATIAEMSAVGLAWPTAAAALTIVVQLGGSLLLVANRAAWLGAFALAAFTLAASVVAHAFWTLDGAARGQALATFLEHLGLIGGFLLVAILDRRRADPA